MEKKLSIGIVMSLFVLGTILAALPALSPVKAQPTVRIYIKDFPDGDNIYAGLPPPPIPIANLRVQVRIVSPYSWLGTPDGIVGYVVSVRVDPRALDVVGIEISDDKDPADGFSDGILEEFAALLGPPASTLQTAEYVEPPTGTMVGFANALVGVDYAVVGGAGGDPFYMDDEAGLATITFKTKSATQPSVIDLMSPGEIVDAIDIGVKYKNARGEEIAVEPEDGYYVAETPDISFFDFKAPGTSVIGSLWHELWPEYCREWRIDSHEDTNGDGLLDASEQIDITRLTDEYKAWYHVEWVNPDPIPSDGKADLIVMFKEEVPEFPFGIGILMLLVPLIPIIYLWRRKELKK